MSKPKPVLRWHRSTRGWQEAVDHPYEIGVSEYGGYQVWFALARLRIGGEVCVFRTMRDARAACEAHAKKARRP